MRALCCSRGTNRACTLLRTLKSVLGISAKCQNYTPAPHPSPSSTWRAVLADVPATPAVGLASRGLLLCFRGGFGGLRGGRVCGGRSAGLVADGDQEFRERAV